MRYKTRTILLRYVGAVVFTALAVLLRWLLDPWLGDRLPLSTPFGAVVRLPLIVQPPAKGHHVHTAYDGQQSADTADTLRPDVLLLDIGLPKLNGYYAAHPIREQRWVRKASLLP